VGCRMMNDNPNEYIREELWADYVGSSTSHNRIGLHGLLLA
jgi:hypothetical protein